MVTRTPARYGNVRHRHCLVVIPSANRYSGRVMSKPPESTAVPHEVTRLEIVTHGPYDDFCRRYETAVPLWERDRSVQYVQRTAPWPEVVPIAAALAFHDFFLYWKMDLTPLMSMAGTPGAARKDVWAIIPTPRRCIVMIPWWGYMSPCVRRSTSAPIERSIRHRPAEHHACGPGEQRDCASRDRPGSQARASARRTRRRGARNRCQSRLMRRP